MLFLVVSHDSLEGVSVRWSVRWSISQMVGRLVGWSVGNLFFRRAETKMANDLFRVYELVG